MSLTYYLMENIIKQIHILVQNINETTENIKKKNVFGQMLQQFGFTMDEINKIPYNENIFKSIEKLYNKYYRDINIFYRKVANILTLFYSESASKPDANDVGIEAFFWALDEYSKRAIDIENAIYDKIDCKIRLVILKKIRFEYEAEIHKNVEEIIRIEEKSRNLSDKETLSKIKITEENVYEKIENKITAILTKMNKKFANFENSQE